MQYACLSVNLGPACFTQTLIPKDQKPGSEIAHIRLSSLSIPSMLSKEKLKTSN